MNDEIKVGDAVTLQHGGQKMTVARVVNSYCRCGWHDRDGHYQAADFTSEYLRKISTGDRVNELLSALEGLSTDPSVYSQSPREETTTMVIGDIRVTIVRPFK